MKRSLSLVLAFTIMLSVLLITEVSTVADSNVYISGDWKYSVSWDKSVQRYIAIITGYKGSDTEVIIPSKFDGYRVTHIGDYAFDGCNSIKSITIPESVTSIVSNAFQNCKSLTNLNVSNENLKYTSINGILFNKNKTALIYYPCGKTSSNYTIPDTITNLGDYAFGNCNSLTSITIPNSVNKIGADVFSGCSRLNKVVVDYNPDCDYTNIKTLVTSLVINYSCVPVSAFEGFKSVVDVVISDNTTSIGNGAFSDCSKLKKIEIGKNIKSIVGDAFKGCCSLETINVSSDNEYFSSKDGVLFSKDKAKLCSYPQGKNTIKYIIPGSVKKIGFYAFGECDTFEQITLPDGLTSIDGSAFKGCKSLTSITIPNSVTSIGDGAFYDCTSLKSITIPESVQEIQFKTFYNCKSLKAITIGSGVKEIRESAFSGCDSLKELIVYYNYSCDYSSIKTKITSVVIPNGTEAIYASAFKGFSSLSTASIPKSVTSIGKDAFYNTPLYLNNWENGLLYIDDCLIKAASGTINGPVSLKSGTKIIADNAFEGCRDLSKINIPNGVSGVGNYAFSGCSSLESIVLPNSVKSIGYNAFENCRKLKTATLSENITVINSKTFINCISLTDIIIPDKVTKISSNAFNGCTLLSNIKFGNGVIYIGNNAFFNCTSLKSITLPGNINEISEKSIGYRDHPDDSVNLTIKVSGIKIYGYNGTAAERYANYYDIPFVSLGEYVPVSMFPDVPANAWFYDAVNYCANKGYVSGYQSGKFGPGDNLKRQDFVVILSKIANADLSKYQGKTSKLKDVDRNAYYAAAVNWAVDNKIIAGYANGKFGVGDNITREQVATILYRYMGEPKVTNADKTLAKFKDAVKVSSFAKDAVAWAVQNSIISGMADGRVAATEGASRAQICVIIMKMDQQGMFNKG